MFKIEMNTDNAAFGEDFMGREAEIARILRDVAEKLDRGIVAGKCRDINGNSVGSWGYIQP